MIRVGHSIGDVFVRFSAQMIASILKGRLCLPFRSVFAAEFMHSLSCASSEEINVFASFAEL